MSCYAECYYHDYVRDEYKLVLLRFRDKYERSYIVEAFVATALPTERIRILTRDEARKDYDLNRFCRPPYEDVMYIANPDRPGLSIGIDAIEPTRVFDSRQQLWRHGNGQGIQATLFMDGEEA